MGWRSRAPPSWAAAVPTRTSRRSVAISLSTHAEDVRSALDAGFAAATILSGGASRAASEELRIAFDGDAVLFSDESERVYQADGLEAFQASERQAAREPLRGGPFKGSWRRSMHCSASFPKTPAPFVRRW